MYYVQILLSFEQNYKTHLMKWQERDMNHIIANRKEFRAKIIVKERFRKNRGGDFEETLEVKPEAIMKKSEFNQEDKIEIVRYLQKKCRIYFNQLFGISHFELIAVKEPLILEKLYDPTRKSFYLFGGRMSITFLKFPTLLTENEKIQKDNVSDSHMKEFSQSNQKSRIIISSESGIGWIFGQQGYKGGTVIAENGLILQITHNNPNFMSLIERNCLMTNRQRQLSIKKFKLFSSIQNLNKSFIPYFTPRKYTKGQYIYMINDDSNDLFLVIDGVIAFQSYVSISKSEERSHSKKGLTFMKKNNKEKMLLVTETLCKNNYFGEEQILTRSKRKQNAKCMSIDCLIMIVPQQKLEKLLTQPEFKRNLELSSTLKQDTRQHQISSFLTLSHNKSSELESITAHDLQEFGQLKSAIFTQLTDAKEQKQIRSRSLKQKKRILHNHSLPEQVTCNATESNFSMLNVNKVMYEKTLMRFRYNLKELKRLGQPKQKQPPNRGRSLEQIWRTLKLEKSFNPQQERIVIEEDDGLLYYNTHQRLSRQIRNARCVRPKSLACSNKLKTEYIQYLQMIL